MPIFAILAKAISIAGTIAGTAMSIRGQQNAVKAQEYAAEFNADQARKQAKYDEEIAQENMRRKRDNNKRELARRRANAARGGLKETGAVVDSLVDTEDKLASEVDDIWNRAAAGAAHLEGQAQMGLYQSQVGSSAAKYDIYGTAIGGAVGVGKAGYGAYRSMADKPPKAYVVPE